MPPEFWKDMQYVLAWYLIVSDNGEYTVIKVYVQLYIIDGIIDAELDQTVYRACTLQTISMKFLLPTTVVTLTYEWRILTSNI